MVVCSWIIFLSPLPKKIDVSSLFKMYIRVCFYIDNKYCLQLKFLCWWYCGNILNEKKRFAATEIKLMGSTHVFTQVFVPSSTLGVPAGCGGATSMSVCRCPLFWLCWFPTWPSYQSIVWRWIALQLFVVCSLVIDLLLINWLLNPLI